MQTLPPEILTHVLSYLERPDLFQCQLTNKHFYEASIGLLYFKVALDTTEMATLLARTISKSSKLRDHLRILNNPGNLFNSENEEDYHFLNVIIHQCPNLLAFNSNELNLSCWAKLSHSIKQGYLHHLQYLPTPSSQSLGYYIDCALLLKNSLIALEIDDKHNNSRETDLYRLTKYQVLLNQIKEFKNLESLTICCQSNKRLSDFDALIEDCLHLKSFSVSLKSTETQRVLVAHDVFISPRPRIQKLKCNWEIIDDENQSKYLMQKFPNLKHLNVQLYDNRTNRAIKNYPSSSLINFLQYSMTVSNFDVNMSLDIQDLANIWASLIRINDRFRDIIIQYFQDIPPNVDIAQLYLTTTNSTIAFPSSPINTELLPINFLSVVGNSIRTLTIGNSMSLLIGLDLLFHEYGRPIGLSRTFEIIHLCPSLQELILSGTRVTIPSPSYPVVKHMGLKKLYVHGVVHPLESTKFLHYMSLNLPNLQEVVLSYSAFYGIHVNTTATVVMPYTLLQLLKWENIPEVHYPIETGLKVCIKLETATAGVNFYIGEEAGLLEITEEKYSKSNLFRFDIKCRSLKELVITEKRSYKKPLFLKLTF